MDRLLSVRVVVAEVAGVSGLRVLSIARDGRTVGSAVDAGGELGADARLSLNAAEVGEGGGEYVVGATRVDVTDPKTFDPESIKGMSAEDLQGEHPEATGLGRPTARAEVERSLRDPLRVAVDRFGSCRATAGTRRETSIT